MEDTTTTRHEWQVILGNGEGQGCYGLAATVAEAADNARALWRENFGPERKPRRFRVCRFKNDAKPAEYGWATVIEEQRFISWHALRASCSNGDSKGGA